MFIKSLMIALILNFALLFIAEGQTHSNVTSKSQKILVQDLPANLESIATIPTPHINIKNKADTVIFMSFKNPDTDLPGSFTIKGKAVSYKNGTNSFMLSSYKYNQDYQFFYTLPDDPRNIVSLFGSIIDPNALQMKITAFYQGNKTYVMELKAVDSMSSVWRMKLQSDAIDSVWNNNETRDSSFRNWSASISNASLYMDKGTSSYTFTLAVKQDFATPVEIKLLDTSSAGRVQLPFANIFLTAPTLEPDWNLDITAKHWLTINLAHCTSPLPTLTYSYKDTLLNNVLVAKTTSYFNNMTMKMTDKYAGTVNLQEFILSMVPPPVQRDSTWLDKGGNSHDSTWTTYPVLMLYKANDKNVLNTDTAYHTAISGINLTSLAGVINPYSQNFWYDIAASLNARTDYAHQNDNSIAPTFKMNRVSGYATFTQWAFRFRVDSARMKYVVNGGYQYKVLDSSHIDPTGNYVRILKDDHPGEFITDSSCKGWVYQNGAWKNYNYEYLVGTSHDSTDVDGIRVLVPNDTTIRLRSRELPKLQIVAGPYPVSVPYHIVYLIEPINDIILTDPDTLIFSWNAAPADFKYRILISAGDKELKNPVLDSLMQDTTLIFKIPKLTPGTNMVYYWAVYALDHNGDGPQSEERNFTAIASPPKGVKETVNTDELFDIFPNPAKDLLTINIHGSINSPLTVSIFNSLGEPVSSCIYNTASACTIEINTEALPSGSYICKIIVGKKIETKKFVIFR